MSAQIPDILLERYRLGEMPPEAMAALRTRCEADPGLRSRLEALDRSDADILAEHPPARIAPRFKATRSRSEAAAGARRHARRPWYLRPAFAAPAGFALAWGFLLAVRSPEPGDTRVTEDPATFSVRLKGAEAGLAVFRKTPSGAELLPPNSLARPGDTLQVFYHSRGPAYGVIFSVDGSGLLTLHLPETGPMAAALQPGDLLPLPHAYRLDRAPQLERFFLVTSPASFPVATVVDRARAAAAAGRSVPDSLEGLEPAFRQYLYTLRKPGKKGASR